MSKNQHYRGLTTFLIVFIIVGFASIFFWNNFPPEPNNLQTTRGNIGGLAYHPGDDISENYAPPWDIFNEEQMILTTSPEELSIDPFTQEIKFEIDVSHEKGVIYKYGYTYNPETETWKQIEFPQKTISNSNWISENAYTNFYLDNNNIPTGEYYVIAYSCRQYQGEWKCSCRSENDCGYWMVQSFNVNNFEELPEEPSFCGNNKCETGETSNNCPEDCKVEREVEASLTISTVKDEYETQETVLLTSESDDSSTSIKTTKKASNFITANVVASHNDLTESNSKILEHFENLYTGEQTSLSPKSKTEKIEINGYIVELREKPLIDKYVELQEEIKVKEQQIINYSINKITVKAVVSSLEKELKTLKAEIPNKLVAQELVIDKSNVDAKKSISRKVEHFDTKIKEEYKKVFNGFVLDISENEAKEIEKLIQVKKVSPNFQVKANLMDSVSLINATLAWNLEDSQGNPLKGDGVSIAIIDTGVDYTHPDLGGCFGVNCKVVGGFDFVNNDSDPMDDHGHGTHCAGIAAGNGVLKGVAPNAKIYSYKVLNELGSGYWDDIIAAIERAVDPNQDGDFSDHLDVISMSLGGSGNPDDFISLAVDSAVDAGVVAVIAAGNSGPDSNTIGSPGTARKAITVGATDKYGWLAYFTSKGPVEWSSSIILKPDVVAPGVNICSAQWEDAWSNNECVDNEHTAISGTSMATPHVAGAAALLLQKNPDWKPLDVKTALKHTAKKLKYYNFFEQGFGQIDVFAAAKLDYKLPTAQISTNGLVEGIIDIKGSAFADNFKNYALFISDNVNQMPEYISWKNISLSYKLVESDILATLDTRNFNDGVKLIRLVVNDLNDNYAEDISILKIDNIEIEDIGRYGYVNGLETIKGYINFDFQAVKAELINPETGTSEELCYQKKDSITNKNLCKVDFSRIQNGKYFLQISVQKDDNMWLSNEDIIVSVVHEMIDGWPNRIEFFPARRTLLKDLDNDNIDELVVPKFTLSSGGWCSGYELRIYDNTNFTTLNYFYDNNDESNSQLIYDLIADDKPSAYYDLDEGKNIMALVGWKSEGLVDKSGKLISYFPRNEESKYPATPITIAEMSSGEKLFFHLVNDDVYDSETNSYKSNNKIFGYNKEGSLIVKFSLKDDNDYPDYYTACYDGLMVTNDYNPRIIVQ
ncbi:MAG: S8 family serine peptidase, partial [Nanoarchaeota archaeon]|nr:S8 family serine peptidase [Nanoarchaeota archaeon]